MIPAVPTNGGHVSYLRMALLGVVVVLIGGCGDQSGGFPGIDGDAVAAAETDFAALDAEAENFEALRSAEADSEAVLAFVQASYSPEIVFDDVTFHQYDKGHEAVAQMYRDFLFYMDEASISHRPYILGDATAVSVIDFWNVTLGPVTFTESEPLVEVDLQEVDEGKIASNTLFYDEQSLMRIYGEEPLFGVVERYISAWNSGDPTDVAGMYTEQATRHDGLAQIDAVGRSGIEEEAERWFAALPEAGWATIVPFAQKGGDRAGVVFNVTDDSCPITVAVVWRVDDNDRIEEELVHYDPGTLRDCAWLN
jgi:ketosteroid isomerase-like protein